MLFVVLVVASNLARSVARRACACVRVFIFVCSCVRMCLFLCSCLFRVVVLVLPSERPPGLGRGHWLGWLAPSFFLLPFETDSRPSDWALQCGPAARPLGSGPSAEACDCITGHPPHGPRPLASAGLRSTIFTPNYMQKVGPSH